MVLLVPANPLRPRRPNEHFAAEAQADREAPGTEPTDKNKKPEEASTVQVDREE